MLLDHPRSPPAHSPSPRPPCCSCPRTPRTPRRRTLLLGVVATALMATFVLAPAAAHASHGPHQGSPSTVLRPQPNVPTPSTTSSVAMSASSSISNTITSGLVARPTLTFTVNGTVTTVVGTATLGVHALVSPTVTINATVTPTHQPSVPPSPAKPEPHLDAQLPPTGSLGKSGSTLHGSSRGSDAANQQDGEPSKSDGPLTLSTLGGKYTAIAMASIGGLLMVMASAGAIGMRRSPRRVLPPLTPTSSSSPWRPRRGGSAGAHQACDVVDQFVALERSPVWLAWIARGMPRCPPRVDPVEAAMAFALGVSVDELPSIRAEASWRAIQPGRTTPVSACGPNPPRHGLAVPQQRDSLVRRVLRSTVMVSGWAASTLSLGRRQGGPNPKVVPVLARNGPVPPTLEARELIRLRRRRSDAGKVSPSWEPPSGGASSSVTTTRVPPLPPSPSALPPFPVSTRAAVMRVGSDRGSMDTELSETYIAPRRKDLLPASRQPLAAPRPHPVSPVPTSDHLRLNSSQRHSSSSTSSSSASNNAPGDLLDPAMIVAEYGPVRLSPPPTQADDLLPDGRPRARSLPAGMLRYAAYMAAQRHAARMRKLQLRMTRAAGMVQAEAGSEDLGDDDQEDDMELDASQDDDDPAKQVVDGEGNVIEAPVYRLPANRARAALVKQPSVSTLRRDSASSLTARMSEAPPPPARPVATLAIPSAVDPDADTHLDALSSPAVSMHVRSRAASVAFALPLQPPMAAMPLPPTPSTTTEMDEEDVWAHHAWHVVTPELAGTFPRRRASDVSTDLSSIIVVLEDDDHVHGDAATDSSAFDLDEVVVDGTCGGVPPHVRSASSPVANPDWAVPAPAAAVLELPRTRSLSPPPPSSSRAPPPLIQLTKPWPAHYR